MVKTLSEKDRQVVKLKAAGKKNSEIGRIVYPDATPESQGVLVNRVLNKPHVAAYYEQEKMVALKKANISWQRITKVIDDAMNAVNKDGEPAHAIRLRANEQAQKLLEVNTHLGSNAVGDASNDQSEVSGNLQRIAESADEAEISRVLFRKSDNGDLNRG